MFDEYDLGRAEELLADDDAAECVDGGGAGLVCGMLVEEETTTIRVGSVLLGQFQLSIDMGRGLPTSHPHDAQSPKQINETPLITYIHFE